MPEGAGTQIRVPLGGQQKGVVPVDWQAVMFERRDGGGSVKQVAAGDGLAKVAMVAGDGRHTC